MTDKLLLLLVLLALFGIILAQESVVADTEATQWQVEGKTKTKVKVKVPKKGTPKKVMLRYTHRVAKKCRL